MNGHSGPGPETSTKTVTRRHKAIRFMGGIFLAVASVLAAFGLTLILSPYLVYTRLLLFFGAVLLTAWRAGIVAGLVAIGLTLLSAELFLFSPNDPHDLLSMAIRIPFFLLATVGALAGTEALKRARRRADESATEAKSLAAQLQDQATELESQASESETFADEVGRLNQRLTRQNDEIERAGERSRRLQSVTAALLRSLTPQQVADVVVTEGLRAIEADAGVLALVRPDGETIEIVSHSGYPGRTLDRWSKMSVSAPLPISDAIRSGQPVWLPTRAVRSDRYPELAEADGNTPNGAWAAIPLVLRERTFGALALSFRRAGEFPEEDRTFMQILAQQCAQALERGRLYEAERMARVQAEFAERRIGFLAEASARLAASLDYEKTLADVSRLIVPEIADWCAVHVVDGDRPRLLTATHADPAKVDLLRMLTPTPDGRTRGYGRVMMTGRAELIAEVNDQTLEAVAGSDAELTALRRLGARSMLSVPIRARDSVLGVLTLASARTGLRYSTQDLSLAEELANRAGQAIDNSRLYRNTRSASQAKSDFLAVMSHELRTPLNAIMGYADLVLLGVPAPVPEASRHQIERIRLAAQQLLTLVDEVLSFARMEAGKEVVRIGPVDVRDVVEESISLVRPLADERRLKLDATLPEGGVRIESDRWKLRQILGNLLSNAVKFTPEGGVSVEVEQVDDRVLIRVRDTGIGISANHLDHIFDAFWQAEQTSTRRFGGTGLGLGVARALAQLLGGELAAESKLGAGSTFTLDLPLAAPSAAELT